MKTSLSYGHYYDYDELKAALEGFARQYPGLCTLESNCVTEKGREQFVMTLTNKDAGDALSKPGWYLDGNIHAGEVTASMVALHFIDTLLTGYAGDEQIRRLLDRFTVYVIPRVSPDGAEVYLHSPAHLRSADRADHPKAGGLFPTDLDGDGVILAAVTDATQPQIKINAAGEIVETSFKGTKRELKEDYNMVKFSDATLEWYEQAKNFTDYATGKTAEELRATETKTNDEGHNVFVDETLYASVSISIDGMINVIAKAADNAAA